MVLARSQSYAYCERLARREAGNFYHAFRVLPAGQRRAMCALYAFLRVTDDLSDSGEPLPVRQAALARWRTDFNLAQTGDYRHRLFPALHDALQTYKIPREYCEAALDGVCMDLDVQRYATFADLYAYCYRVASAVGLMCIHIWGFQEESAKKHAESAGIAFQLTNILRDLGEDAARGRFYLPREDLERFGCTEEMFCRGTRDECFRALMQFEVARARQFYQAGWQLSRLLSPSGRAVFQVMMQTYQGLLDLIEARDYDVFSSRVSLSRWRKLGLAVQALPVRFGLVEGMRG